MVLLILRKTTVDVGLDGRLRQQAKANDIPTQEEDESMSGKKSRHLSGEKSPSDRPVHHHTDLSSNPLTPDHWMTSKCFLSSGACGGMLVHVVASYATNFGKVLHS